MLYLKRIVVTIQLCITMIPVGVSLCAVNTQSVLFALLSIVAVFAVVAILPLCRRRESIWVFFILFLTATPINIAIIIEVLSSWVVEDSLLLTNIIRGGLVYLIALSIEELACGFLARLIWRRQYKPVLVQ